MIAPPNPPDQRTPAKTSVRPTEYQLLRFLLEVGPLILFFGTYLFWTDIEEILFGVQAEAIRALAAWNIDTVFLNPALVKELELGFPPLMAATAALMVAVPAAVIITYIQERRIPLMPLVTMLMVLVFGGLTLILQDETFIKMKPTIVNALFASALFGGLLFGKALLKPLFGPVFQLDEAGWKKLSFRWACFFVFLGLVNEIVWRTQSESTWVYYKVWGVMPLTIIFALSMMPLIARHTVEEAGGAS